MARTFRFVRTAVRCTKTKNASTLASPVWRKTGSVQAVRLRRAGTGATFATRDFAEIEIVEPQEFEFDLRLIHEA